MTIHSGSLAVQHQYATSGARVITVTAISGACRTETTGSVDLQPVDFVNAGQAQVVLCAPVVTLEGEVGGNLTEHTIEWVQLSGPPVVLSDYTILNPTYPNPLSTDIVFRMYVDKGTALEVYDDVTIFRKPASVAHTLGSVYIDRLNPQPDLIIYPPLDVDDGCTLDRALFWDVSMGGEYWGTEIQVWSAGWQTVSLQLGSSDTGHYHMLLADTSYRRVTWWKGAYGRKYSDIDPILYNTHTQNSMAAAATIASSLGGRAIPSISNLTRKGFIRCAGTSTANTPGAVPVHSVTELRKYVHATQAAETTSDSLGGEGHTTEFIVIRFNGISIG